MRRNFLSAAEASAHEMPSSTPETTTAEECGGGSARYGCDPAADAAPVAAVAGAVPDGGPPLQQLGGSDERRIHHRGGLSEQDIDCNGWIT